MTAQNKQDVRTRQIAAALVLVKQDYSPDCLKMASTFYYVVDAVGQLVDAGTLSCITPVPTLDDIKYKIWEYADMYLDHKRSEGMAIKSHDLDEEEVAKRKKLTAEILAAIEVYAKATVVGDAPVDGKVAPWQERYVAQPVKVLTSDECMLAEIADLRALCERLIAERGEK